MKKNLTLQERVPAQRDKKRESERKRDLIVGIVRIRVGGESRRAGRAILDAGDGEELVGAVAVGVGSEDDRGGLGREAKVDRAVDGEGLVRVIRSGDALDVEGQLASVDFVILDNADGAGGDRAGRGRGRGRGGEGKVAHDEGLGLDGDGAVVVREQAQLDAVGQGELGELESRVVGRTVVGAVVEHKRGVEVSAPNAASF